MTSPFHEGERAAQRWARVPLASGAFIRSEMPAQHREFFEKLPFVLVGSVDRASQPSASLLAGPPGFIRALSPRILELTAPRLEGDPLRENLRPGVRLGLLGIEPHTRRRNRANGTVLEVGPDRFTLGVEQSYGNCPKYITPRELVYAALARGEDSSGARRPGLGSHAIGPSPARSPLDAEEYAPPDAENYAPLDADDRALIAQADTFFLASAHPHALSSEDPSHGVDISHRGGPPGFVRFTADDRCVVPDFPGNNLFNTWGNIFENPKVGLLFWDLARRRVLTLWARATPQLQEAPDGSGSFRELAFQLEQARSLEGGFPLRVLEAERA